MKQEEHETKEVLVKELLTGVINSRVRLKHSLHQKKHSQTQASTTELRHQKKKNIISSKKQYGLEIFLVYKNHYIQNCK